MINLYHKKMSKFDLFTTQTIYHAVSMLMHFILFKKEQCKSFKFRCMYFDFFLPNTDL